MNNKKALIMFIAMFFLFCVLNMWQALPLIFLFAIIMTFFKGNREYCSNFCPMGYVQDSFYTEESEDNNIELSKRKLKFIKIAIFVIFWTYLIYYIVSLYNSPDLLWTRIFILIISSGIIAIITQKYIKKRFWCSKLCPFGKILSYFIKIRRG